MKLSQAGINFVKSWEGCKLKAYWDSHSPPIATIGFGQTFYPNGAKVKITDTITQQQADDLFAATLPPFEKKVLARVTRELTQNEFDAAVSFCFNAGTGWRDKQGKYHDFELWGRISDNTPGLKLYWQTLAVTAGGKVIKGLQNRRIAEFELYNKK